MDVVFNEVLERNLNGAVMRAREVRYGVRVCPNPECLEPLFVKQAQGARPATFPVETIDFVPDGVPAPILASFKEAIVCHAHRCFKAAAIMVRRTLEEICHERGATGANLKDRITALSTKVILPKELLEAANELRLLGNDAAHLEAQIYDDVGQEEVEAGLELCKEILKGVYQLSSLVDRLRKLKK